MFYLVCSTPRVGSNLLQSLTFSTEVAGDAREFFCTSEVLSLGGKHCGFASLEEGAQQFERYFQAMQANYTRGAWFAVKAHFHQFRWALEHGFDLAKHFPDRFVYLTRADVVAQAISHVRALQTNAWTIHKAERAEPRFDAERIRAVLNQLVLENEQWEAFFRSIHVEPHRLSYEALCADFEGELTRVLRLLDIDPAGVDVPLAVKRATGYFKVQRDEINADWRARYDEYVRLRAAQQGRVMATAVRRDTAAAAGSAG